MPPLALVPPSSIFRFFLGPIAASAVLLASWRLNSSLSACITSLAFCFSLLSSPPSSPFDRLFAAFISLSLSASSFLIFLSLNFNITSTSSIQINK
ncbi:hypothetical protein BpHYR1_027367 [Brachionus plicatilis]|uniref:Uncharacterized protein n=1 Tax=Brachionus plicatilis TaxID=10195 RepID=A0A3M7PQ31_BRAPC|nr:hypothetical protein BpHYR1_027367 [Brachionus plicatilis]